MGTELTREQKASIIERVEEALPEAYKSALFVVNDSKKTVFKFLEEVFIDYIKDDNVERIVKYVEEELNKKMGKIDFDHIPNLIKSYIESLSVFKETIQLNPTDYMDTYEYLLNYVSTHFIDDDKFSYPSMDYITLDGLYKKLLEKEYRMPTLHDREELCLDMLSYIKEPEVLASIIPSENMSVEDYVRKVLPTKMIDISNVSIGGRIIPIEEVVESLYRFQLSIVNGTSEAQRAEQEKQEHENNRMESNPNIVGEIEVVRGDNDDIFVTTEIPVIKSSNPDEEELDSLKNNYSEKSNMTSEDYYIRQLNLIKDAIAKTTNEHDLKAKESFFRKIADQAMMGLPSIQVQTILSSIEEMITVKRNNLIKISSNSEDYIDVLFSKINTMKQEVLQYTSSDEFSKLIGELTSLEKDIENKGIKDLQLKSEIMMLRKVANERRYITDATIPDQRREVLMIKAEIDEALRNIQSGLLSIEHDPNNLGNLVGTQIRLSNDIDYVNGLIDKAVYDGLLTENDKEYYTNKTDKYKRALQSEEKIGYGTR